MKNILKKITVVALCITSLIIATMSLIPTAKADSSGILNTNVALGSPVLNENFVLDDWNKWEMEVWGIYLSNFCQPLVDTYETAFKTGAGGSGGKGYQALCFGSGSDPANNDVIKSLCDEAIMYQKTVQKQIFVTYTEVFFTGGVRTSVTETTDKARPANFKDLFFESSQESITDIFARDDTVSRHVTNQTMATWNDCDFSFNAGGGTSNSIILDNPIGDYTDIVVPQAVRIPTFWIKNNGGNGDKFIKILDYNDSWDLQLATVMLNSIRHSDSSFESIFEDLVKANAPIILDAFGNITLQDKKMVIPAAINPNLTKEKQINLLNSWVFNGYNSTYSNDDLALDLRQNRLQIAGIPISIIGGFPAFTVSEKLQGVTLLYYDMDTVMLQQAENNEYEHYGKSLKAFFDTDITSENNKYQLKIETVTDTNYYTWFFSDDTYDEHNLVTSMLSNLGPSKANIITNSNVTPKQPKMLCNIIEFTGKKIPLFTDDNARAVIVAPQLLTDSEQKKARAPRLFYNYLYQVYCGKYGANNANYLKNALESDDSKSFNGFMTGVAKKYWDDFRKLYPEYSNNLPKWMDDAGWMYQQFFDMGDNNSVNSDANRLVKVYPVSDMMRALSQTLCLVDGTEFSVYCTLIYATYLDWYGIGNTSIIGADDPSEFNPEIFDGVSDILNFNIGESINIPTKEEREEEILNMGYLLLSPEKGRDYRKKLIMNGIEDFIYEQYNRTVYGGSDSMYTGTASKSNSGFLAIEPFSDNFLTAWFIDAYAFIVTWVMMILVIAIIIIGLLKKRKLSWYAINLVLAINLILIVPSSGEIVPYITSRFVERMFSSKMTYWAVSEGVANASIESTNLELSDDESQIVMNLIKTLSIVYTDRSLMLKQDISQKLTQKTVGVYNDIQNIRSARWLLPMIMQQITGDNNTTSYLYVKLSNVWDDMSNLYWYYHPGDALSVTTKTATSQQNGKATVSSGVNTTTEDITDANDTVKGQIILTNDKDTETYNKLLSNQQFVDYKEIDRDNRYDRYNYRSYSYTTKDNSNQVHLYAWALDPYNHSGLKIPSRGDIGVNYVNADSWQSYIDKAVGDRISLKPALLTNSSSIVVNIESVADQYDRSDRSTVNYDYSYLKTTENIAYYFFYVVKDTFDSSFSLGKVIGMLQGNTQKDANDIKIRESFMHSTRTNNLQDEEFEDKTGYRVVLGIEYTPYVRDILDLENLFTNTIPYLYQVQLVAGGFDGVSGVLEDETIDNLQFYQGQLQSWMYRCNWATKIMENPDFSRPTTVKDSAGNTYTVNNPLLTECYPSERPMVFSEAQMHAYGLIEADLNLVELKCVEVNKNTCDKWTLLINYAGTPGLTKEVLYRQMALDAALIFNEEFSTLGLMNDLYKLYPQSIDLRYLSFDSVMKMLMMNISKNTAYAYGDTMQTLISESDMLQAIFLLIDAWMCASWIPFIRSALLAIIFFLGFAALIRGILTDGKRKAKVACGQLSLNIIFMILTLAYYSIFAALMAITSTDEVLSVNQITAKAGNPMWILIVIMLASGLYIFLMLWMIKLVLENYKDMGFEFLTMLYNSATDKIKGGFASVSSSLSDWASSHASNGDFETGNTSSIKGTGSKNAPTQDVNIKQSNNSIVAIKQDPESEEAFEEMAQHAYTTGNDFEVDTTITATDIDAQIEAGKEKAND